MKPDHIRPIAICVVRRGDRILVYDHDDGLGPMSRPLGGGIEPGELSGDAVIREFREETGWELADIRLLTVTEWLFEFHGEPKHRIVFVYEGRLVDPASYEAEPFEIAEPDCEPVIGRWRELTDFGDERRLMPEGLLELLLGS